MPAGGAGLLLLPSVVLILAGLVLLRLRGPARDALALLVPAVAAVLAWLPGLPVPATVPWLGYDLVPFRADPLSRLFSTVFLVALAGGALFALRQKNPRELALAFVYAGGAVGVVHAGDLVTLFFFWEAMALASTLIVWQGGAEARGAGLRYLALHLLGGVVLMAGIAGHVAETGSIAFDAIGSGGVARWLILAGFLVNAAAWPLSAWLPDAYPAASWSGAVFLSAFTTKTAVYVLLRGFPGEAVLIPVGLAMVFYGIVYAFLENDIRRILAYAIVNQVGLMVTAIGIGTPVALNGAAATAAVHIVYKALLLMAAGALLLSTDRSKATELGGVLRTMPLVAACAIVGVLSFAAFPLTSGFVAKAMIADAAAGAGLAVPWFLLTAASAATGGAGAARVWFLVASAWLSGRDAGGASPVRLPRSMQAAMIAFAALSLAIGVLPGPLYALLPLPVDYAPYTASHVVGQLQVLAFAGLGFGLALSRLPRARTITLDVDWLWRGPGRRLAPRLADGAAPLWSCFARRVALDGGRVLAAVYRHHGPEGVLAREWPTGSMAFWAVLLLGGTLVLYYF